MSQETLTPNREIPYQGNFNNNGVKSDILSVNPNPIPPEQSNIDVRNAIDNKVQNYRKQNGDDSGEPSKGSDNTSYWRGLRDRDIA
jgi:hypothetical protein